MAHSDGDETPPSNTSESASSQSPPIASSQSPPASEPETSTSTNTDRTELLSQARSFLASPQIQHQDVLAKRRFLNEKGLTEAEIDRMLREQVSLQPQRPPLVPPRTYPQLPPSTLPNLLIGLLRLFSWLIGGSAAVIFVYHRFLLPRLILSQHARSSLKSHHLSLLRNLSTSLSSLKESQAESYSVLPQPQRYAEDPKYSICHCVGDVITTFLDGDPKQEVNMRDMPKISLLRCGIEEFSKEKEGAKPSSEELLETLDAQFAWLRSDEGFQYQDSLLQTLSTCPLFQHSEASDQRTFVWSYIPPSPPPLSPLLSTLTNVSSSLSLLPKRLHEQSRQEVLQILFSFTGYLGTQLYAFPSALSLGASGVTMGAASHLAEEELRREIRALKGLVLNRRSFMPIKAGSEMENRGERE